MFEQDAKEYVFGMFPTFNPSRDEYLIDFFKKAAEFGYNKGRNEAKEIIKGLLDSCFGPTSKTVNYKVKAKAEQFLKE